MLFNFFHLMPYPYLPSDFDEKYDSASVTLPNGIFDPERGSGLYNRYLDELEYAEEVGFDAICFNEHHQSTYGLMPSPNIIAAAVARRTSRVKLAIIGNAIALRDHPLRVAEEVAMLDEISGGRIISGFVRGIGFEYFSQGLNPTRSRDRFLEAHDLIIKAWTTRGPFHWLSKNYEFRYVNVWPRPLQQPHPPIWVPGTGSKETMQWVAERRYTYLSVYAPSRIIKTWFDGYRVAADIAGFEPGPEQIGLLLPIYVAETDAQAHEEAQQHLGWLFGKAMKVTPELYFPPGYMSPASFRGILSSGMKAFQDLTYEEVIDQQYAIVGSPSTVADQLNDLREYLGFGNLCALLQIGDMTHERTIKNMDLFSSEVMPQFRADRAPAEPVASH